MKNSNQKSKLQEADFIRHKLFEEKKSSLRKYSELTIGSYSLLGLLKYEVFTSLIGLLPGAFGLFTRRILYPSLTYNCGRGVIWGRSISIRHPGKLSVGNRVVIDDYSLLDARGSGDEGVVIGDDVFIGRNVTIQSKVGSISIGKSTNIGQNTVIVAQGGVQIGEMVTIAGGCSISGGAYKVERDSTSNREHSKYTYGPIRIDKKCRLGMEVMVLDGVHIGEGTIIGAKSLITKDLPEYCVAAGIPAEIKYYRENGKKDS